MSELAVIEIEGLTKDYDGKRAVDHLTLKVNRGEVFGLLGPNGAGKSTTILMMLGLSEPTDGTVHVCGFNATREPLKVKQKVGYLPDNVGFYDDRTGLENLIYTGQLNGMSRKDAQVRSERLLEQVGLFEARHKKAGKYSRGMRQRLGLADVLIKDPEVIILDEPTLGIDPKGVNELLELIRSLSKEHGLTVLLSSHHLHQVQQICDRVGLFVSGRLLATGTVQDLADQLFRDDQHITYVRGRSFTHEFIEEITNIASINDINISDTLITITSEDDVTNAIGKAMLHHHIDILELAKKKYGLDEIYERYFEGGEIT